VSGDQAQLRLASAYADLLQAEGEESQAVEWLTAIAAADPEDLTGAVDRLGIEFSELELSDELLDDGDEADGDEADGDEADGDEADGDEADGDEADGEQAPEMVERLPEDDHGLGRSFDEDVEAEVAELLGETDPPQAGPSTGNKG
jgi:cobalamin biosynthesis protein CobT